MTRTAFDCKEEVVRGMRGNAGGCECQNTGDYRDTFPPGLGTSSPEEDVGEFLQGSDYRRERGQFECAGGANIRSSQIALDPAVAALSAREARARLRTGIPAIEINPHTASSRSSQGVPAEPNSLVVTTFLLNPGEDAIVGRQIRKVLTRS